MRERCPGCGYVFAREDGFGLGAILMNLAVTELLLAVVVIVPLIATLAVNPDTNLVPIVLAGAFAVLVGPFVFYPFSRTLWVALELSFRPAAAAEPADRRRAGRPPLTAVGARSRPRPHHWPIPGTNRSRSVLLAVGMELHQAADGGRTAPANARHRPHHRGRIFISYRRSDTAGFAGRLYDELTERFGTRRVFRDIETIAPASDFVEAIDTAVGSCAALVAVIGADWSTAVGPDGSRRLDDTDDFVRREIVAALDRGVAVVPVLVEGATMPSPDHLPEPLRPLVRLEAVEISDGRWDSDLALLVGVLESTAGPTRRQVLGRLPAGSRRAVAATVSAVTLLATGLGVYWGLLPFFQKAPPPKRMAGDLRIAVAEFVEQQPGGKVDASDHAYSLAESFSEQLDRELMPFRETGFAVSTRPPSETGRVDGATRDARAASAARLAERINANIVVYGVLQADSSGAGLLPEFYVSERSLVDAEELVGQHELGNPVTTTGSFDNPTASRVLRQRLLGRTRAIAQFVIGLGYALRGEHRDALPHLEAAEAAPGWEDGEGKEVLYLFLGNAAQKGGDIDRADAAYRKSVAINGEYGRGRLGVAEMLFQRARGTCEAGEVDADGLERSVAAYRAALDAKLQPAISDVPVKAEVGVSRVYLCQSQALIADRWDQAAAGFERVIAAYRAGNSRLQNLAAEAYGGMGLVHLPPAGVPDARPGLIRSAESYLTAVDLSTLPDRKAAFSAKLGFVYSQLGSRAEAIAAYDLAVEMEPDSAKRAAYAQARQQAGGAP